MFKLKAAAEAGYVLFAGAPLHTKQHLAIRAFEILVVPAVFCAFDELADLCFPAGCQFNIFPVLSHAFLMIAGEHTEQGNNVENQTNQGKQPEAGKAAKQRAGKAGDQREHTKIIRTVAALHKAGKGHFQTLEK